MIAYALRRLVRIPLLLIASFMAALFIVRLAPDGPWDSKRALPHEVEAALARACPAEDSALTQVARSTVSWVLLEVDGCTGRSLHDGTPVLELVARALPVSIGLLVLAVALATSGGLLLGFALARARGLLPGQAGSASLAVFEAMPGFVLAPLFILAGSLTLGLFAPARELSTAAWSVPALALAAAPLAVVARMVRDALGDPAAHARRRADLARGMSGLRARARGVRLALLPVAAHLGSMTRGIIMGGLAVEHLFDLPGLGPLFLDAAGARDTNVVLGCAFTYVALILLANLAAELVYGLIDPRVRSAR